MPTTAPTYTVLAEVGETAAHTIYRALRASDGARVWIKAPRTERASPRDIAQIKLEHEITRELASPGVVASLGVLRLGEGLALVLEDFGGKLLGDVLRAGPLELTVALGVAAAITRALSSVHARGFVHRRISPWSIVFDPRTQRAALTGFGAAARLVEEAQPDASRADVLPEALPYLAPEQTGRVAGAVDRRADLYSLGATIYELLTGAPPFRAKDAADLVYATIARTPPAPCDVAPGVPEMVSSIVMKLLAKSAEDRYQHAVGLLADLEACLAALNRGDEIPPFELGRRDRGELRIPKRLFGRAAEIEELSDAWGRARRGEVLLVLIEGAAGMGKSALAGELRDTVAAQHGYFAAGRFEPEGGGAPYGPVAGAFAGLLRQVLTESEASFSRFRRRLSTAVGAQGQVLAELLPDLSHVLGPQPPVPDLAPSEAQNRLQLVFHRFLHVFATAEHPLALFLDDLQWADPASLKLVEALLVDQETSHLLVIGACRRDTGAQLPLLERMITAVHRARSSVSVLPIGPLSRADVGRLTAAALGLEEEDESTRPLADLLFASTAGAPLSLRQRLEVLQSRELITFDPVTGEAAWDAARIEEAFGGGDITAFAEAKVRNLPAAAQRVLSLAACIGRRFDLRLLSRLCDRPPSAVARDLWDALSEGLVLPLHSDYRLVYVAGDTDGRTLDLAYEIVHERVRRAAAALMDDAERRATHRRIAAALRASPSADKDDELFEILRHEAQAAPLLTDPAERMEVARLALRGGQRARARAAYHAAAGHFEMGASLLGEPGPAGSSDLALALLIGWAECAHLSGDAARSEALFERAVAGAQTDLERAKIAALRVSLYAKQGRVHDALRVGQAALSPLGIHLPDTEEAARQAVQTGLAEVTKALGGRSVESLVESARQASPDLEAAHELLLAVHIPAFHASPALRAVVITEHVLISLRHGCSRTSAFGFAAYASVLARTFHLYNEAYSFGQLALALNERLHNPELTCKVHHFVGTFLHWRRPYREALFHFDRAVDAGLASGDFEYMSFAACHIVAVELTLGADLRASQERAERFLGLMGRTGSILSSPFMLLAQQTIKCLTGGTERRLELDEATFNERQFVDAAAGAAFSVVWSFYHVVKLKLLFLQGDLQGALTAARVAEQRSHGSEGMCFTIDLSFYICLTLAALHPASPDPSLFARHRARIDAWGAACPENFQTKKLIVAAETARASGDDLIAMAFYDEAIAAAADADLAQDEAIAGELAARFYLARGREFIAKAYMTRAHLGYLRWGATAKAEDLARAYPRLIEPARTGTAATSQFSALDVAGVVRAAQAITREIVLEEVLSRSMRIVLENAGAQRGLFLLPRDGVLEVHASMRTDPDAVDVGPMGPAEERDDLALSVVQYVARTQETVILDGAARGGPFEADPYLLSLRPRSLLCLPLVTQGAVAGVLYLENNLTRGAFSPDRVELLRVLASLSAIALRNALLYERIQHMTEELRRTNEGLEEAVARRTAELSETAARLEAELVERARHERERAALEARLAQRDRLTSLGTLAASVAHEINNPLTYVLGNLDFIRDGVAALRGGGADTSRLDDLKALIEGARDGGEKVRRIVRSLRSFSRSDTEERPVPVDVRKVLNASIEMAAHEIRHRAQLVREDGDVPHVMASESRLGQVFLNLLVNAAQAIPEGAAHRNRITVKTFTSAAGKAVVEVHDTGSGIDPSVRSRLFDPFFTTKEMGAGTGLGLSICHSIVTGYDGEIEVESEPERGSCFRVTLPAAARTSITMPPPAPAPLPAPRGRVLIIDDEPFVANVFRRVLSAEHEVEVTTSASAALSRIEGGNQYDVILCDLMMPEMSGMDFYERLRERRADLAARVVFISGGAFSQSAGVFRASVSNVFLDKPCSPDLLRTTVGEHVRALRAAAS